MNREGEAGFSLVEMLVVLAIVGTMAGLSLLAITSADRNAQPEAEAKMLSTRLSLVADEALITGQNLSVRVDETGYSVETRTSEADDWAPRAIGPFEARHDVPGGVKIKVDQKDGRIAMTSDGTGEQATVTVWNDSSSWQVVSDGFSSYAALVEQ